jgi:hypothetical protein
VLGVSVRDKIRSEDVQKQLNTEGIVEEIQEYQKKRQNHVERMPPECLPWQTYSSFYWKTGHWASKEEMEITIPLASEWVSGLNP